MKLRLGWEYFSDLTCRSHVAHTLEVNGQATANVTASEILSSADKLSRQIHTEYPSISPISPDTLARFLAGVLKQMRFAKNIVPKVSTTGQQMEIKKANH